MQIQSNNLLPGANKYIQVVNGCLIAKEGPNIVSKIGIGSLNIPYDSVSTNRQTLKAGTRDMPIMYGFLGTNVTFIAIIPIYTPSSQGCTSLDNHLEYYFEDQPLIRRTFTDIIVLTGNENHRIPQIYIYNPTEYTVTLDIFVANLDENEIDTNLASEFTEIKGLSYNSIRTDQIFCSTTTCTGSTQLEIYDISDNLQMTIPYNKIDIINILNETLTIYTHSDSAIKLTFLSSFNALQAFSRMNWAMEHSISRYATALYPTIDTTPPVITFNTTSDPEPMPYEQGMVSKANIRFRFINTVIDYDNSGTIYRDGVINKEDVELLILNVNNGEQVSAVTYDGKYAVTFTTKDLAGNYISHTKNIVVDALPPTIYYKNGMYLNRMDLFNDPQISGSILKDDLRRYYLNYVWDNVDGNIPTSNVFVNIVSGNTAYTGITQIGYFDINFSVFDTYGNETTSATTLRVVETERPVITYNNVFTGNVFEMILNDYPSSSITYSDIKLYAIDSIFDNYDGNISRDDVTVYIDGGTTDPITTTIEKEITFSVSDSSGNETVETKTIKVV